MPILTRRNLLKASAVAGAYGVGLGIAGRFGGKAMAAPEPQVLKTAKIQAKSDGWRGDQGRPDLWRRRHAAGLRMKKGEPFAARLVNGIDDPTTIHWHGLRIPNTMDGVPFLTQPYVYTGDHFDYAFTPPDAGTFWYHPHCNTLIQMGHGMTGVIVVENPERSDIRCGSGAQSARLAARRRRPVHRTVSPARCRASRAPTARCAPPTGSSSRNMTRPPAGSCACASRSPMSRASIRFRMEGADGDRDRARRQSGADSAFRSIVLQLGPGQRLELVVRMPDDEGAVVKLGDFRGTNPKTLATLRSIGASLKRDIRDLAPLEANPVAKADLGSAEHIPLDPQRHGRKCRRQQHLRLARLQLLGDQQGAVAGRHARSDRAARRAEARQELCHRHGEPDAACAPDPSARHELHACSPLRRARCSRFVSDTYLHPTEREGPARPSSPTIPATGCCIATSSSIRRPA